MANWNLSKRLFMGVGSLVALLLVSGGVSFFTGRQMKGQLDRATKETARQLELALQLQRDGVSLSNMQRGLLLAALGGDQNGLKQTQQSVAALQVVQRHAVALQLKRQLLLPRRLLGSAIELCLHRPSGDERHTTRDQEQRHEAAHAHEESLG